MEYDAVKRNWPLIIYFVGTLLLVLVAAGAGVIKLMAWWQVAMHGCAA